MNSVLDTNKEFQQQLQLCGVALQVFGSGLNWNILDLDVDKRTLGSFSGNRICRMQYCRMQMVSVAWREMCSMI